MDYADMGGLYADGRAVPFFDVRGIEPQIPVVCQSDGHMKVVIITGRDAPRIRHDLLLQQEMMQPIDAQRSAQQRTQR